MRKTAENKKGTAYRIKSITGKLHLVCNNTHTPYPLAYASKTHRSIKLHFLLHKQYLVQYLVP